MLQFLLSSWDCFSVTRAFFRGSGTTELPQVQLWCWLKLPVHTSPLSPLSSSISAHWNRRLLTVPSWVGPQGICTRATEPSPTNMSFWGEKSPWIISFLSVTTLWWEAFKLFLRHSWKIDVYLVSGNSGMLSFKTKNTNTEMKVHSCSGSWG